MAALLAGGAGVDAASYEGKTALHLAAIEGHRLVVQCLLDRHASVNAEDRVTPPTPPHARVTTPALAPTPPTTSLSTPTAANMQPLVQPPPARQWQGQQTPLHKAAINGHDAVVLALLGRGARINAVSTGGTTALHNAAK